MSIKILVLEKDHDLLHFYSMIFEKYNESIEMIELDSVEKGILFFKNDQNLKTEFIIINDEMGEESTLKFYNFLKHKKIIAPLLFISKDEEGRSFFIKELSERPTNHCLLRPVIEPDFTKVLSLYLKREKQINSKATGTFQKVNAIFFLRYKRTLCDIYIKLSDRKFIKLIHGKDGFEAKDIQRYLNKGLTYFYLTKKDYEKFNVTCNETTFLESLNESADSEPSFETTQAILSSLLQTFGVSDFLLSKAFENINKVRKKIMDNESLLELFKNRQDTQSFYYDHALLVGLLASLTLEKMSNWRSAENIEKICIAAMLHDSALEEEVVNTMESEPSNDLMTLSIDQKNKFLDHPHQIAEMIRSNTNLHSEVATIVSEHHEKPDGSGFPRKLTHRDVCPLSALFIVIHDFVEQLYLIHFAAELKQSIIDSFEKKYESGHFHNVLVPFIAVLDSDGKKKEESAASL